MSKLWGQQVVVENKAGGGTNIGNDYVAHADPDGYTVLYGTSSLAVNDTLYRSLDYNPNTDLAPVSMVAKFPFFMFVPNSSPAKTVAEFIAYVKAHQGKLVMGSPGTGSAPHLTAELFLQMAGMQMTHVPYRGAAPAFIDLIPGRIDCYFGSGELLTYSRSGQVRAWPRPAAKEPRQLRTFRPCRVRTAQLHRRIRGRAYFCPAKTPPEIVQKMNADIVKVLAEAARYRQARQDGYTRRGSSPEELRDIF